MFSLDISYEKKSHGHKTQSFASKFVQLFVSDAFKHEILFLVIHELKVRCISHY